MHDILDLDRYPLDQPGSPAWHGLVDTSRAELAREGLFNLEGFMLPGAIQRLIGSVAARFAGEAFTHARRHNIYFRPDLTEVPSDHPAATEFETVNHTLCTDQLIGTSLLELYNWPEFAHFLATTMGLANLYPMADPLAGVNAMAYFASNGLGWHFDRSEFTTTLLLSAPVVGGDFEYRTELRTDTNPNYDGVGALLRGDDPAARSLTLQPGTLNVFRGKNTAHRVTPVGGNTPRYVSVFSYFDRPGVTFTPEERIGFYGRS